jgi:hypothetical protein
MCAEMARVTEHAYVAGLLTTEHAIAAPVVSVQASACAAYLAPVAGAAQRLGADMPPARATDDGRVLGGEAA